LAEIRPFPGIRPRPDLAAKVASPPYDVISSDEARAMAAGNRYSFLHVVKAEIDLGPGIDIHSDLVYQKSAENFRKLIDEGILLQDPAPCFYIYRITMGQHSQWGVMVGASVDEYKRGAIKKHELTRRDKEDDRARHVEILRANAGPVLFTYRSRDNISKLVHELCEKEAPVYDFVASDEVRHLLWVISVPEDVKRLRAAFSTVDSLYVAYGHHLTASAYRVREIFKKKNPRHTGEEAYNYFLAVLFPDNELKIMGYNRVIRDLGGLSADEFLKRVSEKFHLSAAAEAEPDGPRRFGMFLDGKWYRLEARAGSFSADDPVGSLDVSILQENLLSPLLGITDPRTDNRIDFVGGIRGTDELERRCSQDMRLAFALFPVSVAQLMAIADSGLIMPPKSTWFEPKLRSGVVVRSLDDKI
jgi:uncharacterized protein (DUF1015 family)